MNLILSIDEEVLQRAHQKAEVMGTSVDQLIRGYLEELSSKPDPNRDAEEFERLSRAACGDSKRWKFNREELHERG